MAVGLLPPMIMDDKRKLIAIVVALVVVIGIAAAMMGKSAVAPSETINDYKAVPPKGAGKFDREDEAKGL